MLASGCSSSSLSRLTRPASPHVDYADSLRRSGLDQSALGGDWLEASARALEHPQLVELPFHEAGYFPPETPSAVAFRFSLQRGRRLAIEVSFESLGQGRLFVDLFRVEAGQPPEHISAITSDVPAPAIDIDRDGDYLVRVQPELLRGGRFRLVERTLASLPFPVSGLDSRRVQSGFGADRDAGIRQHEGVDIFAAAGTPVVAVAAGVARPDTNTLGGNVVWLNDRRRHTIYYAHLQRSALTGTTTVAVGDVLGYVGNTGNARTTAPHLHFGIYARGALDPMPFIAIEQPVPAAPPDDIPLGAVARVRARPATLLVGTIAEAPPLSTLPAATVVRVLGAVGRRVRVTLPDGVAGYLPWQALTATTDAVSRRRLAAGAVIRERPIDQAPAVHVVDAPLQAEVIGRFGAYELVRSSIANGWVSSALTTTGSR